MNVTACRNSSNASCSFLADEKSVRGHLTHSVSFCVGVGCGGSLMKRAPRVSASGLRTRLALGRVSEPARLLSHYRGKYADSECTQMRAPPGGASAAALRTHPTTPNPPNDPS